MQWKECDGLFMHDYLKMYVGKEDARAKLVLLTTSSVFF